MIESIVRELVTTMQAEAVKKPKVLYIFCDSTAHEGYTDHFILLRNHGIQYDILFLDGITSAWLGMKKIESGGPGKSIAVDEFAPAPIEVPMDYDGIVIPEIDLDNAGRAALGMKGTVKSEIIFSALVLNKFVLVGDDSPGLKRADRRTLRTLELPKPFQKLFDYYKQEMQMYGVEFAPAKSLAEWVVRKCADTAVKSTEPTADSSASPIDQKQKLDEADVKFEGGLVSAEWVNQQMKSKRFSKLILSKGTILSPLAKDMLKEKGVDVQFADER